MWPNLAPPRQNDPDRHWPSTPPSYSRRSPTTTRRYSDARCSAKPDRGAAGRDLLADAIECAEDETGG
jgi:hypothetical protein